MTKLNQLLAIEKDLKNQVNREVTNIYHKLQKLDLFSGLSRTYKPDDDAGERYPNEVKHVQYTVQDALDAVNASFTRLFNLTAEKDLANCTAKADVMLNGVVLLSGVPVTYLLFLEKNLIDIRTLITKLPTLDSAEQWEVDDNNGWYRTAPVQTVKSKKVPRSYTLYEATDKHPAQVQAYQEDIRVGEWATIKFSGAIPATIQTKLLERVDELSCAVKFAREQANLTEVTNSDYGDAVMSYLFG